ncbi:MAG: diadenylate cyclase CdaA [Oscillospiraceae bacterium]|nr:diadenylate cyclase CdaA [Oscillospiraceae bacterium]
MDLLYEIGNTIASILPITLWDMLDIAALAFLIYTLIRLMRETRAGGLFKGILILAAVYLLANLFKMKALSYLMDTAMEVGLFAIIVLFQPELRRTVEKLGQSKVSKIDRVFAPESQSELSAKWNVAIDAICDSCQDLSSTATGALIVVEMETKLGEQIETGTVMQAVPSKELFGNIFYPKTPLHDGAVIIRDGIILAAACFLPKPQNEERINKELGSRHRAAIGMSENSDSIVVVVSEETGAISVAENGKLTRGLSRDELKKYLRDRIISEKTSRPAAQKKTNPPKPKAEKKRLFGKNKN